MELVVRNTSVPVPMVIASFEDKPGERYVLMERMRGKTLEQAWDRLSAAERTAALAELGAYIEELRKIPPPAPGRIASANNGGFHYRRAKYEPFGPCLDMAEFHSTERNQVTAPSGHAGVDQVILAQDSAQAGLGPWGLASKSPQVFRASMQFCR